MELSVVVSTLNGREQLLSCLDTLSAHVPSSTELIVVNGPSSDGTTGAVREREDVDVLVEISERNRNVSRNAGIEVTSGEMIAFVGDTYLVTDSWYDAIETAADAGVDVVTGPADRKLSPETKRPPTLRGGPVTEFDGDNVAFSRPLLEELDGFDERLPVDGARDVAHRLAARERSVTWSPEMAAREVVETDGGSPASDPDTASDPGERYRARAYCLAKNYGPHPVVLGKPLYTALRDGLERTRAVLGGEETPTGWLGGGVTVSTSTLCGLKTGFVARYREGRNPAGLSSRHDRAVRVYDRRE